MSTDTMERPKIGRPSTYSPEIAARVCEGMAQGLSLKTICAPDDMPAMSSVFLWLNKHPEFSDMYARARVQQSEAMAEELLSIPDDEPDVQRARLKTDNRKWLMARFAPRKYGEHTTTALTGHDGGAIQIEAISDFERARALAFIMERGQRAIEPNTIDITPNNPSDTDQD